MSEQNKKFSQDRRGRRTGFDDRDERSQSGKDSAHRDGERSAKRNDRSYFDSNGKYKGRPIAEGEGRRNTYNDLPERRSGRRNDRPNTDRPSSGGYKGRPVEGREDRRDGFDRSDSRQTDREFRRDDRPRGGRSESSRDRHDSRGRDESRSRNSSWSRSERSDSERRSSRGGYQGRPVERKEKSRGDFDRGDSRRRSAQEFRNDDRPRNSRNEFSRDRHDSRGRDESRSRNASWNRSERSDSERRPSRGGYQGRPVERKEKSHGDFDRGDSRRRSTQGSRSDDRSYNNRNDSSRGRSDSRGRDENRSRNSSWNRSERSDSGRSQHSRRDGNEAFCKRPERGKSDASRNDSNYRNPKKDTRPPRPEKKPFVPAKPSVPNLNEPLRINKALAFAGICSRRAADDLIAQGVVFVNGEKVAEPGVKIIPTSDTLEVNGERVVFDTEKVEPLYVLLHKPVQTVCTANDPEGRPTVLDILPEQFKGKRIFPVGRLDFFSTGLLLLTNDGDLTYRLTHPKWHQNKVYRVRVRGDVSEQILDKFRKGMTLEEGDKLAPVECKIIATDEGNTRVEMVLTQGINRQIRRMFRDVGLTILNLHRIKIGPIQLGELDKGESRELTQEELAELYEATGLSK
ncbi:pseudouridine synthase [Halodesulfovibrio sp.]|uniref:pseudouridine synthase n=1 Tax=Halodesulfovibrio sp. TaxID=1912772 RepID=UPI0025C60E0F|nr:pseudouridine synthase [Halodesulfovibrio sp.]